MGTCLRLFNDLARKDAVDSIYPVTLDVNVANVLFLNAVLFTYFCVMFTFFV